MNNNLRNEHGLTLVELLAVLVLMSFISIFAITLIVQSMETTDEIRVESSLRDEADIIVSKFIKAIYETNAAHIIQNVTNQNDSYLNVTNNPSLCQRDESGNIIMNKPCQDSLLPLGFKTVNGITKLYLKNEVYEASNKNIKILQTSQININPNTEGSYEILLNLQYKGRGNVQKEMQFINEIRPF